MLSVVIPIYNEKNNIIELVKRIEKNLNDVEYEIIFVDDSIDETTSTVLRLANNDSRVKLKHRDHKKGLSSAVIDGFHIASGDIIAVMDGDLQHPPEILKPMLEEIYRGADIVIPSRFVNGGSDGGLNLFRKFVSASARYMGKILFKKLRRVSDPTSGIFMIKKSILSGAKLKPIGWKILMEILVLCKYNKLIEVPYTFDTRNSGKSKMSVTVQIQYIGQLMSLFVRSKNKA